MSKLDDAIEKYKTSVDEAKSDTQMSPKYIEQEVEQARRDLKRDIKQVFREVVAKANKGYYDSQAASDATDAVEADIEREIVKL